MARRIGLKDVHIAVVTKNTETEYATETPVRLFKAITGKVSVKRSSEPIYSDDELEDTITSLDAIEVEFEGNKLTLAMISNVLGARFVGGMLVDNKDDAAVEVALGFRAKESNGKYEFSWYYCGKFDGDDEESYETQGQKPSPKTKSLKGTFYSRKKDGNFRVRVNEGELLASNTDAKTAVTEWFNEVQEPIVEAPALKNMKTTK